MIAHAALGSNLGDRLANLRAAAERVARIEGVHSVRLSPVYETEPVDMPPGAAPVLNQAMELDTSLRPAELLRALLSVEAAMGRGRPAGRRFESRVIDLDLLMCGGLVLREPGLRIPHPRMTERWFVLKPLADLCPDRPIPGTGATVREALAGIETRPGARGFGRLYANPHE